MVDLICFILLTIWAVEEYIGYVINNAILLTINVCKICMPLLN